MQVRTTVAIGAGKAVRFLSRRLQRGGGTTYPGELAMHVDPRLLERLAGRLPEGALVVTGTNGKTTTSRMISGVLRRAGLQPVHNRSGANLIEGVASALVAAATLWGGLTGDIGVFEVDEATLPLAVSATRPRAVVVTNLFRDQLDRFGELDHVAALWRRALAALPAASTAVLNADDPLVAALGAATPAHVLYFGIEDTRLGSPGLQHAADSKDCLACGAPYAYEVAYYGHLGKYRCPGCGAMRPQPQVYAARLELHGTAGSVVSTVLPAGALEVHVGLPGLYNVYNALAALACGAALGLPQEALRDGLQGLSAAFGRIERIPIAGRQAFLALVKNPVGCNEVLRMLLLDEAPKDLLIVINDNLADGTDVSWLWDADFELLQGRVRSVVVAGTRAEDMRLRLRYALVDPQKVS
ncbi:MAG TPA: MurT ligase domain-containing protein, partial [Anaerolineae bacterium]|nr:MurT ligase domain-containing protein [Anaerolineae bacterium]